MKEYLLTDHLKALYEANAKKEAEAHERMMARFRVCALHETIPDAPKGKTIQFPRYDVVEPESVSIPAWPCKEDGETDVSGTRLP